MNIKINKRERANDKIVQKYHLRTQGLVRGSQFVRKTNEEFFFFHTTSTSLYSFQSLNVYVWQNTGYNIRNLVQCFLIELVFVLPNISTNII
jgi:hypothetical protein